MVASSIGAAIAAVILVSLWSVGGDVADGYLGVPSWTDTERLFAWHPILMTAGAFFAMVLALSSFAVLPQTDFYRRVAKIAHACLQFAAIGFLVAGVIAAATYKNSELEANLTDVHEWMGVAAMSLYFANFLVGIFKSLNFLNPGTSDPVRSLSSPIDTTKVVLKQVATVAHWMLGLATVYFVSLAILTGISTYLSGGRVCGFKVGQKDLNPASRYEQLPGACQLGNGLGVAVSLSAFFIAASSVISITSLRAGNLFLADKPQEDKSSSPVDFSDGEEKAFENGGRPSTHL